MRFAGSGSARIGSSQRKFTTRANQAKEQDVSPHRLLLEIARAAIREADTHPRIPKFTRLLRKFCVVAYGCTRKDPLAKYVVGKLDDFQRMMRANGRTPGKDELHGKSVAIIMSLGAEVVRLVETGHPTPYLVVDPDAHPKTKERLATVSNAVGETRLFFVVKPQTAGGHVLPPEIVGVRRSVHGEEAVAKKATENRHKSRGRTRPPDDGYYNIAACRR